MATETSDNLKKSKLSGLNSSWEVAGTGGRPRSDTFGMATGIGSTRRSTSTSVLTSRVAITSEPTGPNVAITNIHSDSESEHGIPDDDETQGPERDAAAASPLKGKTRITSSVMYIMCNHYTY
jgi:hypothetical protein